MRKVPIYRDGAVVVDENLCFLQPETGGERSAARRVHHHSGLETGAVCERAVEPVSGPGNAFDNTGEAQIDPLLPHLSRQVPADVVIEPAKEEFSPVELRHMDAQPVEDARELRGDIAAADDHDGLWKTLEMEALVRGDDMLPSRDIRDMGPAARGDKNVRCADARAVDLHGIGTGDPGATLEEITSGILQHPVVDAVQPLDLPGLVVAQCRPIEFRRHR